MATQTVTQPSLSAELFVIPPESAALRDHFLIYAPLRQAAFVANAHVVNFIAALQEGDYNPAADPDGELTALLRRLRIVDAGKEQRPITEFAGRPKPTGVTLFLTTGCNLRCTYCYASAGDTPLRTMPLSVAKQGIDFVSNNAVEAGAEKFLVAFHGGGEPTTNWKVLTAAFEHAQQRAHVLGLSVSGSTATNGILNDTQIDWITAHLDGASVSLDGDPAAQDTHRPLIRGGGSSERVLHTIGRFDEAGFPYGIRVTVTRDQIARLPESIEYICRHAKPQRIQVEPAYRMGRWRESPSAETAEFIERYREARACAASFGFDLVYSAARVGLLTNHFCGVSQDTFALSADGNVSSCYEVFSEDAELANDFFYGRPLADGDYDFDLSVLDRLRAQSVQHKPFCSGCYAKWHCAGDCHHNATLLGDGGEFAGSDRCHITRALTRDQIFERIAAAGGVAWAGDRPPQRTTL